ncbi:MAG: hypothetical protein ACRDS9_20695 [Pseudonocardiaceae bacterium]
MAHFENKYTHRSVEIDDRGVSALGHKFAADEARSAGERQAAGHLKPAAAISIVATLNTDLFGRDIPRDRILTGLDGLTEASWKVPTDEWLRLAADTWRDVMQASPVQ